MEPSTFETPRILGFPVGIAPENSEYVDWVRERVAARQGAHVITFNAEMAMLGQRDREFAAILQQADMLVPDGAGVVLALKMRGTPAARCPGIELAADLLAVAAREQWSVFVVGGQPDVLTQTLAYWRDRLPDLDIDGHHGYLDADTEPLVLERIQQQQPQLMLVGMGVPRQEVWIRDRRHLAPQAAWIGVGGSLDVWSGTKNRAPLWWREHYLEWLYRLYQEPWRWRRMMALPRFAWRVLVRGEKS